MWPVYEDILWSSINNRYPLGQFESTQVEKVFKILDIKVEIICGIGKLLILKEYKDIRCLLVNTEARKRAVASENSEGRAGYAQ